MWSYGLAGLIFAGFAIKMLLGWQGGARAAVLLCAVIASALWGSVVWVSLTFHVADLWWLASAADSVRVAAWFIFLSLLLDGGRTTTGNAVFPSRFLRYLAVLLPPMFAAVLWVPLPPWVAALPSSELVWGFYAWLGTSVFGLVLTEKLYRSTPVIRRWAIKPLAIGLAGIFSLDILMFSGAVLFHQINPAMWAARGIANAIVIFLVGIATARNTSWTVDVYVSRDVVYRSTALLMTGVYLVILSGAAYWVQIYGGDWGETLQVTFVFASLLLLAGLMLSGSLRARIKVLINKHLFSYRYDYRHEWLRFTRVLSASGEEEGFYKQVVRALADLVEGTGGALWLERQGVFSEVASVNMSKIKQIEPGSGALVAFLERTDWVIHIDEFLEFPDKYPGLVLPDWLASANNAWLVIPLPNGSDLIGFVILASPRAPIDVNWEVRDLVKTASRQAASYLAHIRAKKALIEVEQFDAFNRMSAFVVHDLKNLVAQLDLLVKNAERHRDNPEFQKDMLETVQHAVGRMNQLMLQLRTGTVPIEKPRPVDLSMVIRRVIPSKAGKHHMIDQDVAENLRVLAHEDRIERVIGHIVQNALEALEALEATEAENDRAHGRVRIRAFENKGRAVIEISDNGKGMTEEFMRNQLFHPFQTTKTQGMGIGMYESQQYVTSIGGKIAVKSVLHSGSQFDVVLPLVVDDTVAD